MPRLTSRPLGPAEPVLFVGKAPIQAQHLHMWNLKKKKKYEHVSCKFDREWLILSFASCVRRQDRLFYVSIMMCYFVQKAQTKMQENSAK